MDSLEQMCRKQQNANSAEYGKEYSDLKFAGKEEAEKAENERDDLLKRISCYAETGCKGSKVDCRNLSEGCRLCGEGRWSCLFINGICNCKCFYCPSSQEEKGLPSTNAVSFNSPEEYVAYLKEFGFKGCSISGGEPLLTPKLTLSYVKAVKKAFKDKMYMWMYTNGTLVTDEILAELKDAGLNEIRFDIGAVDYCLKNLKKAVGVIPVVTVEIPAVPEEAQKLKNVMKELCEIGINHLNLHQLRLTPYNMEKFRGRGYTFLHGEKVTVLESELLALSMVEYAEQEGLSYCVNYCSFVYKNRFQGRGSRAGNGSFVIKPYETFTESGNIRLISMIGTAENLAGFQHVLDEKNIQAELREMYGKEKMLIHPGLLQYAVGKDFKAVVSYFAARQLNSVSYRNPFREIRLTKKKSVTVEKYKIYDSEEIDAAAFDLYKKYYEGKSERTDAVFDEFEIIPSGFQKYF